jgi:hypothetical protein
LPDDTSLQTAYREAYNRWQVDLQRLHAVLLDEEVLDTPHRVALLRSESHTHDRYEAARRRLLGLPEPGEADVPFSAGESENA